MIIKNILKYRKEPAKLVSVLFWHKPFVYLPVDWKVKIQYRCITKRKLDFNQLQRFYEKIAWVKNRYHNPLLKECADKYTVRGYVANKIGEEYLVPIYGVYSSLNEMDFSCLPNQFVLKATHTSGNNLFCRDKEKFITSENLKKIKKWLRRDYWLISGEWCYKNLPKRIICEKLLIADDGKIPKDYKFYCFNGKPEYLEVIYDRKVDTGIQPPKTQTSYEIVYDMEWNLMEGWTVDENYSFRKRQKDKKPECFNKMKEIAAKLSEDFPHVRVDLYEVKGKIYFGELTFFSSSGYGCMIPDQADFILGQLLNLEHYKKFI